MCISLMYYFVNISITICIENHNKNTSKRNLRKQEIKHNKAMNTSCVVIPVLHKVGADLACRLQVIISSI